MGTAKVFIYFTLGAMAVLGGLMFVNASVMWVFDQIWPWHPGAAAGIAFMVTCAVATGGVFAFADLMGKRDERIARALEPHDNPAHQTPPNMNETQGKAGT